MWRLGETKSCPLAVRLFHSNHESPNGRCPYCKPQYRWACKSQARTDRERLHSSRRECSGERKFRRRGGRVVVIALPHVRRRLETISEHLCKERWIDNGGIVQ